MEGGGEDLDKAGEEEVWGGDLEALHEEGDLVSGDAVVERDVATDGGGLIGIVEEFEFELARGEDADPGGGLLGSGGLAREYQFHG